MLSFIFHLTWQLTFVYQSVTFFQHQYPRPMKHPQDRHITFRVLWRKSLHVYFVFSGDYFEDEQLNVYNSLNCILFAISWHFFCHNIFSINIQYFEQYHWPNLLSELYFKTISFEMNFFNFILSFICSFVVLHYR